MSPDMKRLVQAVKDSSAPLNTLGLRSPKEMDLIYGSPEAIVRAVLTELREVPEAAVAKGTDAYYSALMEDATGVIWDYIDGILSEPATDTSQTATSP